LGQKRIKVRDLKVRYTKEVRHVWLVGIMEKAKERAKKYKEMLRTSRRVKREEKRGGGRF